MKNRSGRVCPIARVIPRIPDGGSGMKSRDGRTNSRKSILILILAGILLWMSTAAGADFQKNQPWIQDDADLLTDAEEQALAEDMAPICEYGTPMFWTTRETGDYTALARDFYHRRLANGESGTLFVINMRARQLTIFSDGAIYRVVTNGEAETITDNVYRMAGREEYYECASSVFRQIHRLLRGEQIARPMKLVSNILLALALSLLIVYLYLSRRYETRPKTGAGKAALPVTAAAAAAFALTTRNASARMTRQKKTDISSGSGGGHGHGGGFSGGGGGHSSGGGGSHGF